MNRHELLAAKSAVARKMAALNAEMDELEAKLQVELAKEERERITAGLAPGVVADIEGAMASADAEGTN